MVKHINGFINTYPLWTKHQFGITQFVFPDISLDTFTPQPIAQNLRLGHQIEHVFHQLINHDPTYTTIGHNLQLKEDNITIGELDFILKHNDTQQLYHVELTYKFYIIDPTITAPIHRLMGPNRRDMFFAKMEKTKSKQFPLLFSKEGEKILDELEVLDKPIVQQCCFLAQLFAPYKLKTPAIRPLNTQCIIGYWLRYKEFNAHPFDTYVFYIPKKNEWIVQPHHQVL